jgi:hypothetical protein
MILEDAEKILEVDPKTVTIEDLEEKTAKMVAWNESDEKGVGSP